MLTLQDIKTLESLFIVEMHSAERIFRQLFIGNFNKVVQTEIF